MLETHPFPPFVPPQTRYLLLGSFTGKPTPGYDWYYCTKTNQFWPILEAVYHTPLLTKSAKQRLFTRLRLAVTDIIYKCQRKKGNSLDSNLINIVYNTPAIQKILDNYQIKRIFFSSRFVEKNFKKLFPHVSIPFVTLPSPSPRYAAMSKSDKIKRYRELLPSLPKS